MFSELLHVYFQAHAVQNHPRSRTFFNREQPGKKEIGEDLFYCCPECDFDICEECCKEIPQTFAVSMQI